MYTPQAEKSTIIPVNNQSSPVQDYYLDYNKNVMLTLIIIFSCVVVGTAIPLWVIKGIPFVIRVVIPCSFLPSIIILLLVPYASAARIDRLNHTITFMRKGFIPFNCSCCRTTFRTNEISELTMEKSIMKGKKYYTLYANFKSGAPREAAITGHDNTCSINYSPQLDLMLMELNKLIAEVN